VIIPPPFVWPAAGVLVLMLYGLRSQAGFGRHPAPISGTGSG